jgi:hypothetical protein
MKLVPDEFNPGSLDMERAGGGPRDFTLNGWPVQLAAPGTSRRHPQRVTLLKREVRCSSPSKNVAPGAIWTVAELTRETGPSLA